MTGRTGVAATAEAVELQTSGGSLTISGTTIAGNSAIGAPGARAARAVSAATASVVGSRSTAPRRLTLTSSVLTGNLAQGGPGGGDGFGGGVYTLGTTTFTDTLATLNDASGGSGGGQGIGGGLYIGGGTTTLTGKTKVVANFASTSNNDIYGPYGT